MPGAGKGNKVVLDSLELPQEQVPLGIKTINMVSKQ
ncbi:hypothetical protein A2U01_0095227, partial [Trifolium medium]|nr:hypothetical protein [Trifolium medium]